MKSLNLNCSYFEKYVNNLFNFLNDVEYVYNDHFNFTFIFNISKKNTEIQISENVIKKNKMFVY